MPTRFYARLDSLKQSSAYRLIKLDNFMRALSKMTRDLLFFTLLLLVVRCDAAESLFGNTKDTNSSSWVCDLGRTTGSCMSIVRCTKHLESSTLFKSACACDDVVRV